MSYSAPQGSPPSRAQQFPQSGPARNLYNNSPVPPQQQQQQGPYRYGPAPPSQVWNQPQYASPAQRPPQQQWAGPQQPAWGPPPQQWRPPQPQQPNWGPPPPNQFPPQQRPGHRYNTSEGPVYQQQGQGMRPPMMAPPPMPGQEPRGKPKQRHQGPSGPDGTWAVNDLVTEPEAMLNEEQLKVWKEFDNKEIDREGPKKGFIQRLKDGELDWNKWYHDQLKWKNMKVWIIAIVSIALSIVILVEQKRVINALKPFGNKLKNEMQFGWLIPVAVLFVLSFPPLFGAEIITIIVAVTWNIWQAWGITSLGTFAGEMVNYLLFKWLMKKRQEKLENKSVYWAKLSKVSKDGGFFMVLAIRYSLIPTHLSTTLFAACGVPFWVYTIATALSQPRWLFHILIGHAYGTVESKTQKYIFTGISIGFAVLTQYAMKWIQKKQDAMDAEIKQILRTRRADALNAVRTRVPPKELGLHKRLSSSSGSNTNGTNKMYLQGGNGGHRRSNSNASFASSSETAVGSQSNLANSNPFKDPQQPQKQQQGGAY